MPRFLTWWWVRLLIGLSLVIVAVLVAGFISVLVDPAGAALMNENNALLPPTYAIGAAVLSLEAYALHLRFVERRPGLDIGLGRDVLGNSAVEFLVGCLVGLGLMALVATVLSLAGAYEITAFNPASFILPALMTGILAGVTEEIILRGLIFRLSEEWMGSVAALAVSSLIFGFGHAANANATLFSSVAITLEAGVLLGLAYMFTRRLWLVIGIHLAWNTCLGGLFGMPVSGYALPSIMEADVQGPDWLTGGAFGPEASVTVLIICGMAAAAFAWGVTKRGEWRRASWRARPAVETQAP